MAGLASPTWAAKLSMDGNEEESGIKLGSSGEAEIRLGVLLQPRLDYGESGLTNTNVPLGVTSQWSGLDVYLRHARVSLTGQFSRDFTFRWDFGDENLSRVTGGTIILQTEEAYVDWKLGDSTALRMGRTRMPIGRNSQVREENMLLIERPFSVAAAMQYFSPVANDKYPAHLQLRGAFSESFEYRVGLGDGMIGANQHGQPMIALRGAFHLNPEKSPSELHMGRGDHTVFGLSVATQSNVATYPAIVGTSYQLMGLDAYHHSGPFSIQFEYLSATTTPPGGVASTPTGYYLQGGYLFGESFEGALRVESNSTNTALPKNNDTYLTLGGNYYVSGPNARFGFNLLMGNLGAGSTAAIGKVGSSYSYTALQVQATLHF
ncbi:MAG: OprO/OprP family phosphate-selective porin [Deltaproteobacteria bacterium]|nr:OprO/OprP family phosphate-selective porin [Deltaproteobacteria bacterium]